MKKNLVCLVAALATTSLAITSCGNDADQPITGVSTPTKINLAASLASSMTRADYDLQTSSMDFTKIGVYAFEKGYVAPTQDWTGYQNFTVKEFTGNEDGVSYTLTTDSAMFFPLDQEKNIDVYLYAPYTSTPDLDTSDDKMEMTVTVNEDQSTNEGYLASDFLYGKKTAKYSQDGKVNVNLQHAHAKILIKVVPTEGFYVGKVTDISMVGVSVKTVVNLGTGSCTTSTERDDRLNILVGAPASTNDEDVAAFVKKINDEGVACVIPAQKGVSATKFKIVMDGKTAYANLKDVTFESGYQYNYTLTVVGSQIHAVCTITPWTDGGTKNINLSGWE